MTFGRSVTLSGTTKNIAAGTSIELQQNPYPYSGFKASGKTAVIDPAGNWSIGGVMPSLHTQYRVVAKTSPPTSSGASCLSDVVAEDSDFMGILPRTA